MSDFKYCLLKYGDLSSEEEKKLRSIFPKLIKYDPVVHTKSPLQIGEYDILYINVKPGLFGGESDGFKYFKANKWDEFVLIYAYDSRKNVDYVVNAQFKVRNLPLNFAAKDEFIGCVLETANNDSDLVAREPKTPAAPKQPVVSSEVVAPSLCAISEQHDKSIDEKQQQKQEPQQPNPSQNALIDSLNKLSSDYEKSVSDVTNLKRKILGLEADVARLSSEKQSLSAKAELMSQLESELVKLKNEKANFEKKLPELEELAKKYESEKNKTVLLASQIADNASVKSELQKLKDENSQKVASIELKNEEIKQLTNEKSDLQSKFSAQQEETKKIFQVLVSLRETHATVSAENAKVKESEAQRVMEIVKLRSENMKLKSELDLVKEQLRIAKNSCVEEETKSADLQSKISQLTQSLNSLQSIVDKQAEAPASSAAKSEIKQEVVNHSFRGDVSKTTANTSEKPEKEVASPQKEQKLDVAPTSSTSQPTVTPDNISASKDITSAKAPEAKVVTETKAAAEIASISKKIKDFPQAMIECKLIQGGSKVTVEYLDVHTLTRAQKVFDYTNNPNQNSGILRQAMMFYKERQCDVKRELVK